MELLFTVKNQELKRIDKNIIVANSQNYLFTRFDFSEDWNGLLKTAIFEKDKKVLHVILDESDLCMVPSEIITEGKAYVSVFGGDLITTHPVEITIQKSGLKDGEVPAEPTPDVYTQLIDAIGKKADTLTFEGNLLTMFSSERQLSQVIIARENVSITDFGAIGDGATDNTAAIQAAIDSAGLQGFNLFIPAGMYNFSDRLFIRYPVQIIGASSDNTVLHFTGGRTPQATIHYGTEWWEEGDSAICIQSNNVGITALRLYGVVDNTNTTFNGISMHWTQLAAEGLGDRNCYRGSDRVFMQHVVIQGFRNDMFIFAGWQRFFQNCEFLDATECGVKYYPLEQEYTGNWSCSGDIFMGCGFGNNEVGFHAQGCYQNIMYNGVFEFNRYAIKSINNEDIQFINCWNEANESPIYAEGNVRFIGGYNVSRNTVDHKNGYATIDHDGDVVIFKGDTVLFHQQNGIITKGVNIGVEFDNLVKNPAFYINSQGVAKLPSLEQWSPYPAGVATVNTEKLCDGNYSVLFDVSGATNNPEYCIEQRLTVESGKYTISCQVLAQDRTTLDAGFNTGVVYYNSTDETIGWDNYIYTLVGNNVWETASTVVTVPANVSYIKIKFGPKQNGVVYMANPVFSNTEIEGKNNVYMRLDEENQQQVNVYNVNGVVVGKLTMTI